MEESISREDLLPTHKYNIKIFQVQGFPLTFPSSHLVTDWLRPDVRPEAKLFPGRAGGILQGGQDIQEPLKERLEPESDGCAARRRFHSPVTAASTSARSPSFTIT